VGLTCSFDASSSTDDGTVTSYAWTFGDGQTGTGLKPSHPYATAGPKTVTLTVTDDLGVASAPVSHQVNPTTSAVVAADLFARTVANGWGTADTGGAWTVGGVAAANFSVSAGLGRMKMPATGNLPTAYLNGTSVADSNSLVDVTFDKVQTGSSYTYAYLAARRTGTSLYRLRAKLLPTVTQLSVTKTVSGTETVLATSNITGLKLTAGTFLRMRFQVSGTSSVALAGKIWVVGATEPATAQVKFTDTATPLGAGALGLAAYLPTLATNAPVTASFANYSTTSP
jgi:PKD repeat protein